MTIDVQGLVGCKIEYTSLPYRSVHAYAVETAGIWDRDSELKLYTRNRWHLAKFDMDFRSSKTDIMQIQKLLTGFCVGLPTDCRMVFGPKDCSNHERNFVGMGSLMDAFFDNSKEIDADEMNEKFHNHIPIMLEEEKVLKAFSQARDMYIYTNRRILHVDTKGLSGQRVKYKSIPYKHIHGFEFETAGHMDRDAEIYCYTTIADIISSGIPRQVGLLSTKQSILVKHTDIYEMGKLMMEYCVFAEQTKDDAEPEIEVKL